MTSDPNDRLENQSEMPAEQPAGLESASSGPATEGSKVPPESESGDQAGESGAASLDRASEIPTRIGRNQRDWEPIVEKMPEKGATEKRTGESGGRRPGPSQPEQPPAVAAEDAARPLFRHPSARSTGS